MNDQYISRWIMLVAIGFVSLAATVAIPLSYFNHMTTRIAMEHGYEQKVQPMRDGSSRTVWVKTEEKKP